MSVKPAKLGGHGAAGKVISGGRRKLFDAQTRQCRYNGSLLSARSMSTQYSEYEIKETVKCKICDGNFVPGGVRINLPPNVCLWCYTRSGGGFKGPGAVYRRMMLLWKAVQDYHADHAAGESSTCDCEGCKIYRIALPIMEPSATIQTSEIKP